MLPNKETNSSEESECDDLDPNTSMEVETIILVIYFFFPRTCACFEKPLLKGELVGLYRSWTYVPIKCDSHKVPILVLPSVELEFGLPLWWEQWRKLRNELLLSWRLT